MDMSKICSKAETREEWPPPVAIESVRASLRGPRPDWPLLVFGHQSSEKISLRWPSASGSAQRSSMSVWLYKSSLSDCLLQTAASKSHFVGRTASLRRDMMHAKPPKMSFKAEWDLYSGFLLRYYSIQPIGCLYFFIE